MRLILTLRHWQILFLLFAYEFVVIGFLMLTELSLPKIVESLLFGWIPSTVYPLLLGLSLNKYIISTDVKANKNFKHFLTFWTTWTVIFFVSEILKANSDRKAYEGGIPVLSIVLAIVGLFALFKFIQFPSRTIKSIELKREAGLWEYIADSFQILFWPLCIWWIQPRINRINDKQLRTT